MVDLHGHFRRGSARDMSHILLQISSYKNHLHAIRAYAARSSPILGESVDKPLPFILSLTVNYFRLGCFKDKPSRAMPKVLGTWRGDSKAVQKCALAAEKAGYSVFGVQHGGECWSGPQAHVTYKKYGTSTKCVNGKGGNWAQDVYAIVSKWCVSDVTFFWHTRLSFSRMCICEPEYFSCWPLIANAFNIFLVSYKSEVQSNFSLRTPL